MTLCGIKGRSYAASKVVVIHPEKPQLLLVKRQIGNTFGYEAAGGRVYINFSDKITESFEECAIREAEEELGLTVRIHAYLGSYAFFWESKPHTCTHCVVYLASPLSALSNLKKIGDPEINPVYPEWVDMERILKDDVFLRPNHEGLRKILKKSCSYKEIGKT